MPNTRMSGVRGTASLGCRAAPARSCLLTGIVSCKLLSLAGFMLSGWSSAPHDQLTSRLSLPPYTVYG